MSGVTFKGAWRSSTVAEFAGHGKAARFSIERRRGNGWETIEKHSDEEFAVKRAGSLALTNSRTYRVVRRDWVPE